MGIINWVKTHKLSTVLLVIIFFPFATSIYNNLFGVEVSTLSLPTISDSSAPKQSYYNKSSRSFGGGFSEAGIALDQPVINTQVSSGMVMRSSNLSLLVSDVRQIAEKVKSQAESMGGFLIQSNFSNPGEAPNATITIRVPASSLDKFLSDIRGLSIRVVSEDLEGYDITDQYTDVRKRLDTLNQTRKKFEEIYAKATDVQDILDVQNRLIENQNQIDQLKGQEEYMRKSAELAKVTVYLSTDELALPYDSDTSWRPGVIFKQAVRSLVGTLHGLLNFVIWILVYAVVWLPIVLIIYIVRRKYIKKTSLKAKL